MPKKYPVLALAEVLAILKYWDFEVVTQSGSHAQYGAVIGGIKRKVTVDMGLDEFDDFLLRSMVRQSGLSRNQFYLCTKATAKKINGRFTDFRKPSNK